MSSYRAGWRSLTLRIRIRDVLGSNHGPITGYPKVSRDFHQSLQANGVIVYTTTASFQILSIPSITLPCDAYLYGLQSVSIVND
jgi:hypothetical protein